jgi:hypothetical protein
MPAGTCRRVLTVALSRFAKLLRKDDVEGDAVRALGLGSNRSHWVTSRLGDPATHLGVSGQ